MISQKELQSLMSYNPETGVFTRAMKNGEVRVLGFNFGAGYTGIAINRKPNYAHRLAWVYMNGDIPKGSEIDHINNDKKDNRICNLRLATRSENQGNVKLRSSNTSGYKGVYFNKRNSMWTAQIMRKGKRFNLGSFSTPKEAHEAYVKASVELFGEYSNDGFDL